MLKNLLKRKVKLATTQEAFDKQADEFLKKYGFEATEETRAMFGALVQHSDDKEDWFDPELAARQIRKAFATRCAFYLIYPDKRPKKEEASSEQATVSTAKE